MNIFKKIKNNKGIICGDSNAVINYIGDGNSNVVQVQNVNADNNKRYELRIILKNGKVKKHKYRDIKTLRNCVEIAWEEKDKGRIKDFICYIDGKEYNNNFDKEESKQCFAKIHKNIF